MSLPNPSARVALWLAAALVAGPAAAESSASSAASTASTSVASLSTSITQSSASSSRNNHVADGDYRVIEVAELAGPNGLVRLTLQPVAGRVDEGFDLNVPAPLVARERLATGAVVQARHRPYGIEFAQGEPRRAFFLVLADAWYRELQTTPVGL